MVSVVQREWAAKNPRATFRTPITVEDVLNPAASVLPLDRWQRRVVAAGERRVVVPFAAKLALDKSATSRRLQDATDRSYLVNLETRRGRPADRHWRSDAGNGEAAARAGQIGCVIEVLHCCCVAEGVTWVIPVTPLGVAHLRYSGEV